MDKVLLEILVCPSCKGKLLYDKKAQTLICRFDKFVYAINDGIPNMLIDEAHKLDQTN